MTEYIHVVPQYAPVIGGAQQYCAQLSETLVKDERSVSVFTTRLSDRDAWENDLPGSETINGVQVQRFSAQKRGRFTWRVFHWCRRHYAARPSILLELGLMLAEGPISARLSFALASRRKNVALVHLFGVYSALVWEAFSIARLAQIPIVVTPFVHTTPPIGLNMIWKRRVLEKADHVIAMTPSEKIYLEQELGLDSAKVSVVSPALEVADYPVMEQSIARHRLGLPNDAFVVLFIGRKEPHKGILTLLEAFQVLLGKTDRACRLVLVGPEIPQANMPSLHPFLDNHVIDLGEVDHNTKNLALNACDCLAFPSSSESFGIVILEAWAAAKPVVVTRLDPIQDTVTDNEDGLLTDVGSVTQLAQALSRLAEDQAKATTIGLNGRRKFLSFYTTATMSEKIKHIYGALEQVG